MGFMDKLKGFGKKAAMGALLASQRSYASVFDGKHKGCKIGMDAHGDLLMIQVADLKAKYNIKETFKNFAVVESDIHRNNHMLSLFYKDGEESHIKLVVNTQQGSALPTAEERIAAQHKDAATFVKALADVLPAIGDETKKFVNVMMAFVGEKPMY